MVVLICGDFDRIWALKCTLLVCKGPLSGSDGLKIVKNSHKTTFGHILFISTSKKLEINPFSSSTNLLRLLGEYKHLIVLSRVMFLYLNQRVQKLDKMARYMTFGHIPYIITSHEREKPKNF